MNQLHSWFSANKLTLNTDKSSFTIFKSKRKIISNLPEYIEFLDLKIKRMAYVEYLGVIMDENLTWDNHINDVCSQCPESLNSIQGGTFKQVTLTFQISYATASQVWLPNERRNYVNLVSAAPSWHFPNLTTFGDIARGGTMMIPVDRLARFYLRRHF